MSIRAFTIVALVVGFCVARFAGAASIGDLTTASTNTSGGHAFFGQTFAVPAGETGIPSVTAVVRSTLAPTPGAIELYNFDESTSSFVGGPLYSSAITAGTGDNQVFSAAPNLTVTAGATMALVVDWGGPIGDIGSYYRTDNYYPDGHLILAGAANAPATYPTYDLAFQVQFGPVPEPGSVLAMIPLALIALRRRMK